MRIDRETLSQSFQSNYIRHNGPSSGHISEYPWVSRNAGMPSQSQKDQCAWTQNSPAKGHNAELLHCTYYANSDLSCTGFVEYCRLHAFSRIAESTRLVLLVSASIRYRSGAAISPLSRGSKHSQRSVIFFPRDKRVAGFRKSPFELPKVTSICITRPIFPE